MSHIISATLRVSPQLYSSYTHRVRCNKGKYGKRLHTERDRQIRTETAHKHRSSRIESYKCARALWKWQSRRYWSMTVCLERTHEKSKSSELMKQNMFFSQIRICIFSYAHQHRCALSTTISKTGCSIAWCCAHQIAADAGAAVNS